MNIADLLAASRSAHMAYRQALPRKGSAGDPQAAADALRRAYDLRVQAEHADVDGGSPSWHAETVHYPLLAFYADQVKGKPFDTDRDPGDER